MPHYFDKTGLHETLSDAEIADRIAKLREAEAANTAEVESEFRRVSAKPTGDSWTAMVKAENEVIEGIGDRDEAHHAKQSKKLRKQR